MASLGAFFSPVSSNIYYPALNSMAASVHVSGSLINLTITSYMVSVSVLISHLAWAHEGVDMMVGHTNAGASDLDRASIGLLGSTPALEDS